LELVTNRGAVNPSAAYPTTPNQKRVNNLLRLSMSATAVRDEAAVAATVAGEVDAELPPPAEPMEEQQEHRLYRRPRRRQRAPSPSDDDDEDDESDDDYNDDDTPTTSASLGRVDSDDLTASPLHRHHRLADAAADASAAAESAGAGAGAATQSRPAPARPVRRPSAAAALVNRVPTPQDLAELSYRIYKKSPRRLYAEADAQGMRVWRDERVDGDVRLVLAVPAWFPKPGAPFDWSRVRGGRVSVVVVVRGTVADLVGNTKSNLQLVYGRLVDDSRLPESAHAAASALQRWMLSLVAPHPELRGGGGGQSGERVQGLAAHAVVGDGEAGEEAAPQRRQQQRPAAAASPAAARPPRGAPRGPPLSLSLDVVCTGHSLGAFVAEAATVENEPLAAAQGWTWRAVTFDGPGLPAAYADAALARRGGGAAARSYWRRAIRRYLAAPNPINMLYPQTGGIGSVTHVLVPFEQTWSHVARCVAADAARVLGWAVAGTVGADALGRWRRRRRDAQAAAEAAAAANGGEQEGGGVGEERQEEDAMDVDGGGGGPTAHNNNIDGGNGNGNGGGGANATNTLLQGAAAVAAAQLRRAGAGAAVPVLGPLAAWALGAAGLAAVPECLAAVLGVEVDELLTQHGLGSIRPCFDPDTGELRPELARPMRSWPHLGASGRVVALSACRQVAAWTLPSPLCPGNVGVVHVGSRSRMVEARCRRLAGYVPLAAGEGHEALDREDEEAEAEAAAAAAAAIADGRKQQKQAPPMAALPTAAAPAPTAVVAAAPPPAFHADAATGPLYSAAEAATAAGDEGTAGWGGTTMTAATGATAPAGATGRCLLLELPPGPELDAAVATPLATAVTVAAAEALRRRARDQFQVPGAGLHLPGVSSRTRAQVGAAQQQAAAAAAAAQASAARRRQQQQLQGQPRPGGGNLTFGPAFA